MQLQTEELERLLLLVEVAAEQGGVCARRQGIRGRSGAGNTMLISMYGVVEL